MKNKNTKDFIVKFNELNPDNKKYLIAIQQALAFAQSSSSESEEIVKGTLPKHTTAS